MIRDIKIGRVLLTSFSLALGLAGCANINAPDQQAATTTKTFGAWTLALLAPSSSTDQSPRFWTLSQNIPTTIDGITIPASTLFLKNLYASDADHNPADMIKTVIFTTPETISTDSPAQLVIDNNAPINLAQPVCTDQDCTVFATLSKNNWQLLVQAHTLSLKAHSKTGIETFPVSTTGLAAAAQYAEGQ